MLKEKSALVEEALLQLKLPQYPSGLYDPMRYILSLGGKRMRPVLVMLGHELFGGKAGQVIPQALAIELFHNFSLIHDDIMDRAPIRRGKSTVHKKWNENTAILSGDGMLVIAYQQLVLCEKKYLQDLLRIFSETAIGVCEGQQLDMEFEKRNDVSIEEYLNMIALKTAVLLGAALEIGAVTADATNEDAEHIYEFGKNLGIAFQLQDDLLDAFGNEEKFGKKSGGDIASDKKTFLLLSALKKANGEQRKILDDALSGKFDSEKNKITGVLRIYDELNIAADTRNKMDEYLQKAMTHLEKINVKPDNKKPLIELANQLMVREY